MRQAWESQDVRLFGLDELPARDQQAFPMVDAILEKFNRYRNHLDDDVRICHMLLSRPKPGEKTCARYCAEITDSKKRLNSRHCPA